MSAATCAELLYGVERSSSKRIDRPILDDFVRHLDVLSWGHEAAEQYGKIHADLETQRTPDRRDGYDDCGARKKP